MNSAGIIGLIEQILRERNTEGSGTTAKCISMLAGSQFLGLRFAILSTNRRENLTRVNQHQYPQQHRRLRPDRINFAARTRHEFSRKVEPELSGLVAI